MGNELRLALAAFAALCIIGALWTCADYRQQPDPATHQPIVSKTLPPR